jgi:hypothetical protein
VGIGVGSIDGAGVWTIAGAKLDVTVAVGLELARSTSA